MHRADEPQQLEASPLLDLVDREHEEPVVIEELLRERLEQILQCIAGAALGVSLGLGLVGGIASVRRLSSGDCSAGCLRRSSADRTDVSIVTTVLIRAPDSIGSAPQGLVVVPGITLGHLSQLSGHSMRHI